MYTPLISTFYLILPLLLFLTKQNPPWLEIFLATLLSINIFFSLVFWSNPVKHSRIHVYDSFFAKLSYVIFVPYILYKPMEEYMKIIFLILLAFAAMMMYYSNCYSKQTWCCQPHEVCHSMFHMFTGIGCMFAFL